MFFKSLGRHRLNTVLMAPFVVALLLSTVGEGARFQDRSMLMEPGCRIREYTKYEAKKDGCKSQAVPARGCFGRCHTYEVPMLLPPHKASNHKMCSFEEVEFRSVEMAECNEGVNRTFVYQSAVRCRCNRCNTSNTYCAGMN